MAKTVQASLAACTVLLGAGISLAATTGLIDARGDIHCEVRERSGPQLLELVAVAIADAPATGSYTFSVERVGAGGSSVNRQRGLFTLTPGIERTLTSLLVSRSDGDRHTASLTLEVEGREIRCGHRKEEVKTGD